MSDLSERLEASVKEMANAPFVTAPVWDEHFSAIREAAAALAAKDAEIAREEKLHEASLAERDEAEDAVSQAFCVVTGNAPEWSNLFGYKEALDEIAEACAEKDARIAVLERLAGEASVEVMVHATLAADRLAEIERLKADKLRIYEGYRACIEDRATLRARLAAAEAALEQAQSCILDETPEIGTHEEAREDTLEKIRRVLTGATKEPPHD